VVKDGYLPLHTPVVREELAKIGAAPPAPSAARR
jgi:hypothetical protein